MTASLHDHENAITTEPQPRYVTAGLRDHDRNRDHGNKTALDVPGAPITGPDGARQRAGRTPGPGTTPASKRAGPAQTLAVSRVAVAELELLAGTAGAGLVATDLGKVGRLG